MTSSTIYKESGIGRTNHLVPHNTVQLGVQQVGTVHKVPCGSIVHQQVASIGGIGQISQSYGLFGQFVVGHGFVLQFGGAVDGRIHNVRPRNSVDLKIIIGTPIRVDGLQNGNGVVPCIGIYLLQGISSCTHGKRIVQLLTDIDPFRSIVIVQTTLVRIIDHGTGQWGNTAHLGIGNPGNDQNTIGALQFQ